MGMSASQARLLSITARLTDNEMSSQLITNSKLRLADKSGDVSSEYMKALNATELMFYSYDNEGKRSTKALTPASLINYAELKNQYALVNTSGQIMVSSIDKANYEKSATMAEFLACYDVPLADNPKHAEALEEILGEDYSKFMDGRPEGTTSSDYILNSVFAGFTNNTSWWIGDASNNLPEQLPTPPTNPNDAITSTDYNNWVSKMSNTDNTGWMDKYLINNSSVGKIGGELQDYIDKVKNPPVWNFGDEPIVVEAPDFSVLSSNYKASRCYTSVEASVTGIQHMEHNLSALIWGTDGLGLDGGKLTNSSGTITVTNKTGLNPKSVSLTSTSVDSTNDTVALVKALKENSQFKCVQNVIKDLQNLYCDMINYLSKTSGGSYPLNSSKYSISSNEPVKTPSQLKTAWDDFYKTLENLNNEINAEVTEINKQHEIWSNQYNNFKQEVIRWQGETTGAEQELIDKIKNLPPEQIPDESDPKYEWYKNLWYRMGGISESKKSDNANNYKELDNTKMYSSEWLQFALEQGILTLEQVNYSEDGSAEYPNIGFRDWISIQYKNSSDITSQQNEAAITKAEVKYKEAMNDIEQKDKKFDQDLKKLDSIHNALQTEYDSLKSVIEKNVERSFKAFS